MTVQERRVREKNEVREKILDAARDLFVTHGYEGVTMRKVADRIEYSPTAIYLYFADKESLFREICHQDFHRLSLHFVTWRTLRIPLKGSRHVAALTSNLPWPIQTTTA